MYTDYTLAFEFVIAEKKFRQIDTITQWNWDLSCQKKTGYWKFEAEVYTDTTLTRELVAFKIKFFQFDAISKWNWDRSCQKKRNCEKFKAKVPSITCELIFQG